MKAIRLSIIICFLSIVGCDDALTIRPENSLTYENGLTTAQDFESLLNRIDQLFHANYSKDHATMNPWRKGEYANDWLTDNEAVNGARTMDYPSEYVTMNKGTWTGYYRCIVAANIVTTYLDNADLSKEQRDLYRGQALFYKALSYFDIIHRWGDCILVKDDLKFLPEPKTRWEVVADYAIEVCREACDLLPEFDKIKDASGNAARYKNTPCRGAANALLAHLCAWKAGGVYFANTEYETQSLWEEAEAACTAIIGSETGNATGIYRLAANPEEVVTSVMVGDSQEGVYELVQKDFLDEFGYMVVPGECYIGYPIIPNRPAQLNLYLELQLTADSIKEMYAPGDLRRKAYFYRLDELSEAESSGFAFLYKHREAFISSMGGDLSYNGINQNYIYWRLADIYLLRAECRVRLGKTTEAIADLNEIRRRANAAEYDPAEYGGDLRYAIFKEREKELLAEGHRYYDVIRNGYANSELEGKYQTASVQDFKDGAFFMMIDDSAFSNNPELRQNAYWFRQL